ncbi:hypothetical protein ACO0R3_003794 [Hanseniaspora guilliermondii]
MFNTSSVGTNNQGSNGIGNLGLTPGLLQSTPTAPSTNNPVNSALPNMFQSVKKADTTTGLFGNKAMNSPTPNNQPALFSSKPSIQFPITSQNNTSQPTPNTQYEGIGVYGVQPNPLTMTVGQQMPPALVNTSKSKTPKQKRLNLNEIFLKTLQNQHYLQSNRNISLQRRDNQGKKVQKNVKYGLKNKDLKKLDINKDKIQQVKDRLFKKEFESPEPVNASKAQEKLEKLFGDKETIDLEEEDNDGYWCHPDIKELMTLSDEELVQLDNFTIGRKNCGNIRFVEPVDLNHLMKPSLRENLFGRIVNFNEDENTVDVYPDEYSEIKPNIGEGLNVRAMITLFNVQYDKSKYTLNDFIDLLKSFPDNEFISYDPFSKIWIFKVRHFSKYGLIDNEDKYKYNGVRNVFKSKVVKPFNPSKRASKESVFLQPGYLDTDTKEVQENPDISNSYSSSVSVNNSLKRELLENPNIIKEMTYEPMNVEAEDIQELVKDNINKNFEYSDDLINQLKFANGSIYNKIQLKKELLTINLEKEDYFDKRENISVSVDEDEDVDINIDSQITKKDEELLKDLKESCTLENVDEMSVKVNKTTLKFKDIKEYSIIFQILGILLDEEKEIKFKKLFEFINSYCMNKLTDLKISSEHNNIFKHMCFNDVEGAVELSLKYKYNHLPSIISLLNTITTSREVNESMKKIAEECIKSNSDESLLPIYRVLANDESLIYDENSISVDEVDSDMLIFMRLMSVMNYKVLDDYDEIDKVFKKYITKLTGDSLVEDSLLKCLKIYAEIDQLKKVEVIEKEKVFESIVFYSLLKYSYDHHGIDFDSLIICHKDELDFNGVLENIFLSLFISDNENRNDAVKTIIKNNMDVVIENKDMLINDLQINFNLVYTLIADYYSQKGQIILEMNNLLKTTNNEDRIISLFLNKTGPYMIFKNKINELLEMLNIFGNSKLNDSVEIMKIYLEYKIGKQRDLKLLRRLVEKIELFQTDKEEFKSHLYKFVIEQYMLNYNMDDELLPKELIQFINNLHVENENMNNYFQKIISSTINNI